MSKFGQKGNLMFIELRPRGLTSSAKLSQLCSGETMHERTYTSRRFKPSPKTGTLFKLSIYDPSMIAISPSNMILQNILENLITNPILFLYSVSDLAVARTSFSPQTHHPEQSFTNPKLQWLEQVLLEYPQPRIVLVIISTFRYWTLRSW